MGLWLISGPQRGPDGRGVQGLFDQFGLRCGEWQAGRSSCNRKRTEVVLSGARSRRAVPEQAFRFPFSLFERTFSNILEARWQQCSVTEVIGQHICSEAPDRLRVWQGSSAWSPVSCCFCLSSGGSLWLCAASLSPAGQTAPRLSARFYFAPRLWLLIVFFISPPTLNILFWSNYLSLCINSFLSSCHLSLPSFTCVSPLSHQLPLPAFAVLWRSTEANRTDGLRWFPGSAHFYREQPGIAAGLMLFQGVCRAKSPTLWSFL